MHREQRQIFLQLEPDLCCEHGHVARKGQNQYRIQLPTGPIFEKFFLSSDVIKLLNIPNNTCKVSIIANTCVTMFYSVGENFKDCFPINLGDDRQANPTHYPFGINSAEYAYLELVIEFEKSFRNALPIPIMVSQWVPQ